MNNRFSLIQVTLIYNINVFLLVMVDIAVVYF